MRSRNLAEKCFQSTKIDFERHEVCMDETKNEKYEINMADLKRQYLFPERIVDAYIDQSLHSQLSYLLGRKTIEKSEKTCQNVNTN